MGSFSERELEYLQTHGLARLATITATGGPHVVPVDFTLSEDRAAIDIGGYGFGASKKYRDLQRNPSTAIVIDDFGDGDPRAPRGIEIRGRAELHSSGGPRRLGRSGVDPQWVRIVPEHVYSWGIEGSAFTAAGRLSRDLTRPATRP